MPRLVTILKSAALVTAPVLLATVIIWRTTTVRTEPEVLLADGVVIDGALMFWCYVMKEPRRSRRWRRARPQLAVACRRRPSFARTVAVPHPA